MGNVSMETSIGSVRSIGGDLTFTLVMQNSGIVRLLVYGCDSSEGREPQILLSIDEGQFQQLKEVISKTDEVVAILRNEAKSNPVPSIQRGQCFSMIVEDVFQIRGRGICVMGRILDGSVKIGDPVTIDTAGSSVRSSIVAIEKYQQSVKYAVKGETVGLVLSAVSTEHAPAGSLIRSGIA